MRARVGDRLLVNVGAAGGQGRACAVLGFWDPGGEPPYFVQWYDTGDAAILVPPVDASIVNCGRSTI
jgi:hypothetical protein